MALNVSGNLQLNNYAELIQAANRMERGEPAYGETNSNSSQNFSAQDSAQDEALINDINDMIDELQANISAGAGNELESMMSRIAGRLLQSGLSSAASNAIMLEVERRDGRDGRVFSAEEWERVKEGVEKERTDKARVANIAEDMNEIAERRQAEIARREAEYANVDVTMGDITMTGRNWRAAAMLMRDENFRREMEAWARARGYTDAEIEEAATVSEEIMLKNARGESLTPEEQRASEENELVRENIRRSAERVQPGVTNSLDAQASVISANAISPAAAEITAESRASLLSGGGALPSPAMLRTSVASQIDDQSIAPAIQPLRANFAEANAATGIPLDQRTPQALAGVTQVAPVTNVTAGANAGAGGLDV